MTLAGRKFATYIKLNSCTVCHT